MANWIAEDSSGQGNNFLPNSLATYDVFPDTPTNNFCTLNFLDTGPSNFHQGALRLQTTNHNDTCGTFKFPSTGKWYFEIYLITAGAFYQGIFPVRHTTNVGSWDTATKAIRGDNGSKYSYHSGGWQTESYGSAFGNGDIVQCAVDMDNGKIWWGDSGTWIASGDPGAGSNECFTFTASLGWKPMIYGPGSPNATDVIFNFGQTGTFVGYVTAGGNADGNGYGNFKYSVPSGFLALCEENIPEPAIIKGTDYFNTVLWEGNGSTDQDISGVGFQPDLIWIKNREATNGWHAMHNSVRGAGQTLFANDDGGEEAYSDYFGPIQSDGYRLADVSSGHSWNTDDVTYVGWNWKIGWVPTASNSQSAGATPTAGSVKIDGVNLGSALPGSIAAEKLTANTTAGFSIVNYPGGAGTVAHGLGVAPKLVLQRKYDSTGDWLSYTSAFDESADAIRLNTTASVVAADPETVATSTVFSSLIGGNNTIALCFAEVEGYSKIGAYKGDGTAYNAFINTGFTPALIIIKSSLTDDWLIFDNKRHPFNKGSTARLFPNANYAEATSTSIILDFVSNGFRLWSSDGSVSADGEQYMYYAVAEKPFKYANAR